MPARPGVAAFAQNNHIYYRQNTPGSRSHQRQYKRWAQLIIIINIIVVST